MNPPSAVDLCNAYVTQLHKAEEDKAFLLAHKKSLPRDEFDILLSNADRDIAFARLKLQRVTPFIQVPQLPEIKPEAMNVKTDVKPEVIESKAESGASVNNPVQDNPAENNSSDNAWWIAGAIIGGLVAISWAAKDPKKNLAAIQDVLKIIKKTSEYGRL